PGRSRPHTADPCTHILFDRAHSHPIDRGHDGGGVGLLYTFTTSTTAPRRAMTDQVSFNLSKVFSTVAAELPDQDFLVWRDKRLSYAEVEARVDGVAHFLTEQGLGCHTERA